MRNRLTMRAVVAGVGALVVLSVAASPAYGFVRPAEPVPPGAAAPDLAPLEAGPTGPDAAPKGVVRPTWVRQPAPFFPALAASRGIEQGDVTLRCEALASGELGACEILHESPPNAGFGEAALASIREARVQPRSIDGFRTDSRIAFTMRFRMAPEP